MTLTPNSKLGEWIRFISSAIVIPLAIFGFGFALRVERFMTKTEAVIVTRSEMELRLATLREQASEVKPEVRAQLADLKVGQANLSSEVSQLRRDLYEYALDMKRRSR